MGKITLAQVRKNGKRVQNKVLAYGEVTGHTHALQDETAFERYELDGKTYLVVTADGGVHIDHEEHGIGLIEPGLYEVRIDREYDYMAEMARNSID